jgi:nucleotide-binding universal stress UspA family protein
MNILSMLARLEHALGCPELTKQMVLLPATTPVQSSQLAKDINLVVGYNASPRSQTALDLTLWIAHQTRLATGKQVTVQVVYVVNWQDVCGRPKLPQRSTEREAMIEQGASATASRQSGSAIAELPALNAQSCQLDQFEQADHILWQARHLADEWRGSLKTHLRFGGVATELRQVVEAESASLLLLGCESIDNPIVQQLGPTFPCPVLGIPAH